MKDNIIPIGNHIVAHQRSQSSKTK